MQTHGEDWFIAFEITHISTNGRIKEMIQHISAQQICITIVQTMCIYCTYDKKFYEESTEPSYKTSPGSLNFTRTFLS